MIDRLVKPGPAVGSCLPRAGALRIVLSLLVAVVVGLSLLVWLPASMATLAAAICGVGSAALGAPLDRAGIEARAGTGILALGCVVLGGSLVDGGHSVGWPVLTCGLGVAALGVALTSTVRSDAIGEAPAATLPPLGLESDPFGAEIAALRTASEELHGLLSEVEARWPTSPVPVDGIRAGVARSIAHVEEAAARWSWAPPPGPERAAEMDRRLERTRRLDRETEDETEREELRLSLECQQRAREALEELARDEARFRLGLDRLTASLESLALAVRRAVVSGRDVDTGEVDSLVAALTEASAALDPRPGRV